MVTSDNLPVQLTSFVGRRLELEQIEARLHRARLVTLVGVGGGGKTRLAIEAAKTVRDQFPEGVWLLDFAQLDEASLVANSVAAVLGVPEPVGRSLPEALAAHLHDAEMLLLLDNCEHLVTAVAELAGQLLCACSGLRVLATSRERLGITGETLWPVRGLHSPPEEIADVASIKEFDAVRLFSDRAIAIEPTFGLSGTNATAVANICRRLDGVPLAIELAAARINSLGVQRISERMDDRFRVLTAGSRTALPRHQTLRGVVEWSYALLDDHERRVFDRLSVFVGGFTREAVEAVVADRRDGCGDAVEALYALVDKSLVTAESVSDDGRPRYRLLDTLRAFGSECLEGRGEAEELRRRHAAFMLEFAELSWTRFRGPEQTTWLNRLEEDHGNIRAALGWSLSMADADMAVRLAGAVAPFWDLHGHYREGRRWLERALAADGCTPDARVRALNGYATLALIQGDLEEAIRACETAADIARTNDDQYGLAYALQYRGFAAMYTEDLDLSAVLLNESLTAARQAGDPWLDGWSLLFLTALRLARGKYDQATRMASDARPMLDAVGEPEGMAWGALIHGAAALAQGDLQDATTHLQDSLHRFWELKASFGLSIVLLLTGKLAGARDLWDRGVGLLAASETLRESIGAALLPFIERWLETAVEEAHTTLGAETFDTGWLIGSEWALGPAVREAAEVLQTTVPNAAELQLPIVRASRRTATDRRPAPREATFRRDGEYWTISYVAPAFRLQDILGLQYLARLLSNPHHEWHVHDVAATHSASLPDRPSSTPAGVGDAGPIIDDTAKRAYRRRLRELADYLAEAERWADIERAAHVRAEIDALTDQIAAAVGLGGRDRKAASQTERVRVNVTKAIRSAIRRIARHDALLGQHLDRSVRTGTFCSYTPDDAAQVTWRL
jgi:predicted ATPase